MKHKIEIAPNLAIYIDGERVIGSKPQGLFLTTEMIVSDEDLKRLVDRCLEVISDSKTEPQTATLYDQIAEDIETRIKCANAKKIEDEPQTEEHCENCRHKDECEGATYEYKNTEWWCLGYEPIEDEPQTEQVGVPFGEMGEATFKSHCLNCQRDTADIKCLDCDGNKYFLPYGSKTDCAWK